MATKLGNKGFDKIANYENELIMCKDFFQGYEDFSINRDPLWNNKKYMIEFVSRNNEAKSRRRPPDSC